MQQIPFRGMRQRVNHVIAVLLQKIEPAGRAGTVQIAVIFPVPFDWDNSITEQTVFLSHITYHLVFIAVLYHNIILPAKDW
ncbi:hypothetical protein D3C76_1689520 [compost metagenome]